jgi:uncharacterized membrane protein
MESTIEKLKDLINNFDPVSYLPDIAAIMSWASLFARICVLVAPAVMLLCGLRYLLFPPKEANHEAGYRFYFGMGSVEAWRFTQLLAGCVWTVIGLGLSIAMYFIGKNFPVLELGAMVDKAVVCILWQIALIVLSYIAINLTLIIRFNRHGDVRWKK